MKTTNSSQALRLSIMNRKQTFWSLAIFGALFTLLLLFAAGCGEDSVTNTTGNNGAGNDNISMSVKNDEATDNPAELTITEAKALITEVEVESEPSGQSHYIRIAPFVINFNMNGTLIPVISGNIPAGTYNKIKFKIHKPEDNETPPDPEFKQGTSGNQRFSFIVKGTYNGNSFVYKSKKSANLVIFFNAPVNLQENSRNITVLINPLMWFKNGNVYIDPSNPENENIIDDNLKNSFRRAFKDDNRDGRPDDN